MDAKYEAMDLYQVMQQQHHLSTQQKEKLRRVLEQYPQLTDGKLGHYKHKKVHIELDKDAKPFHSRPYAVPKVNEDAFLKELNHLVEIGVLRPCGPTEWGSPTFIIPKKDGRVRWISDFRELNKVIKRKVYNLPVIHEVIQKRSGYKYFTKLDLTMFYYNIELDEASKELCTIVTPYGKYQYCRMAMGLKLAPDIAQSIIEEIMTGLDVDVYIDDIGIFSNDFDEHIKLISQVCQRLEDNGLKVNPLKCEWAVRETDFLGYWMTPEGIKPWKKKVDAVLKMDRPKDLTQLRSFIGAVTHYRTMWPRRSHVLAPLTALTGKSVFEWTDECDKAFKEMKALMASDALCAFPNHNLPFHIYIDASDYQMGAAIIQNNRVVAYWSAKLNSAQQNYSTMEKELLSAVKVLNEFRTMLLGAEIHVYTDHRNLTFRTLNSQRVLRWRLSLEDFAPTFHYIPGPDNVLADCFSRLPRMAPPSEGKTELKGKLIAFDKLPATPPPDEVYAFEDAIDAPDESTVKKTMPCHFSCCRDTHDDEEILDSFLQLPELESYLYHPEFDPIIANPIHVLSIQQHQFEDNNLQLRRQQQPHRFPIKYVQNRPLICYRLHDEDQAADWKVAIPSGLIERIILWYHNTLGHCGINRLYDTIRSRFHYPKLKELCASLKCDECQKAKQIGIGYGHLPPRHAQFMPWNEVAIDLIGPWTIPCQNGEEYEFTALTCIDPVTNLTEMIRVNNKTAEHVAEQFVNCWLSKYPRPNRCIHDNGGEFIGNVFQLMLQQAGVEDAPTTSRNPQANAICERMHQTVANVLRSVIQLRKPLNREQAVQYLDNALATAVYASRVSVSRSLGVAPGSLAFHRDMLVDLPLIADLVTIQQNRQALIDENLRRQNRKRREFHYAVGQEVLIKTVQPNKLEKRAHGPYPIVQVYTNGTMDAQRATHVLERLNIRRVIPYKRA